MNAVIRRGVVVVKRDGYAVADVGELCSEQLPAELSVRAWARLVRLFGGRDTNPSLASMNTLYRKLRYEAVASHAANGCHVSAAPSLPRR